MKYGEVLLIFTENVKLRQLKSLELNEHKSTLVLSGFGLTELNLSELSAKRGKAEMEVVFRRP